MRQASGRTDIGVLDGPPLLVQNCLRRGAFIDTKPKHPAALMTPEAAMTIGLP
jgi:hypothetical protein